MRPVMVGNTGKHRRYAEREKEREVLQQAVNSYF